MKFKLEIEIKGDALRNDPGSEELSRLIREAADKIDGMSKGTFRPLIDYNGNTVGQFGMR